jgi:hypothetical protein
VLCRPGHCNLAGPCDQFVDGPGTPPRWAAGPGVFPGEGAGCSSTGAGERLAGRGQGGKGCRRVRERLNRRESRRQHRLARSCGDAFHPSDGAHHWRNTRIRQLLSAARMPVPPAPRGCIQGETATARTVWSRRIVSSPTTTGTPAPGRPGDGARGGRGVEGIQVEGLEDLAASRSGLTPETGVATVRPTRQEKRRWRHHRDDQVGLEWYRGALPIWVRRQNSCWRHCS